ncbi:MAG: isochorismatase family protein [Polaromonas sp.]|jgi:nicotinamidase-related amidase|nr:isochorismatase family protein [Polaromonas sp.]
MSLRGLEAGIRTALLISECQRGVLEPGLSPFATLSEQASARGIVPRIARLAQVFRNAKMPVVHLHVAHRPDYADVPRTSWIIASSVKKGHMKAGSMDVEAMPGLEPQESDHVQSRRFALGSFHGTELDTTLRHLGVKTLVVVGVSTNVAVNATALAGSDLGYQVLVPEDCIAGATVESHEFVLRNLLPLYATITTQAAVEAALRGANA